MGAEGQKSGYPTPDAPPAGYPPAQPPAGYPPAQPPAGYPSPQGHPPLRQQYQYQPQQPCQSGPGPYSQPPPQAYYYQQQPQQAQQQQQYKPSAFNVQQHVRPGSGYDPEAAAAASAAAAFSQQAVRRGFVRKVLLLVLLQLAVTVGVAAVFMFVNPVQRYVSSPDGRWLFWVSWVLAFVGIVALACSTSLRRRYPYNIIALFGFTAIMSVLVGCVVAYYKVQVVLIAFGTTAGVVLGLTIVAFIIPFDLTKRGHILGAAAMMFFFAMLITILVGFFYVSKWWYVVISCIGALLFGAFLVYDLQMVIGGKTYEISPDEYVFASVQIYMDIIQIFLFILSITGMASR